MEVRYKLGCFPYHLNLLKTGSVVPSVEVSLSGPGASSDPPASTSPPSVGDACYHIPQSVSSGDLGAETNACTANVLPSMQSPSSLV